MRWALLWPRFINEELRYKEVKNLGQVQGRGGLGLHPETVLLFHQLNHYAMYRKGYQQARGIIRKHFKEVSLRSKICMRLGIISQTTDSSDFYIF